MNETIARLGRRAASILVLYKTRDGWQRSAASLTAKAAVFTCLLCLLPMTIIGWYVTQQTMAGLTQAALRSNEQVADRVADDISTYLQAKKNLEYVKYNLGGQERPIGQTVDGLISSGNLATLVEQVLSKNPGYMVTVIDENRIPHFAQSEAAAVSEKRPLTDDVYQQAVRQQTGSTTAVLRGQEYLVSFRPIANTPWLAVAAYPQQLALQSARDMVVRSLVVIALISVVCILLGIWITRRALRPLAELAYGTAQVADGDLTYRLATQGHDEIGRTAAGFNHMTDKLQQIVYSVKQAAEAVLQSSGQVLHGAEYSHSGSTQVAAAVIEMAEQMLQQVKETETTETVLIELEHITNAVSEEMNAMTLAAADSSDTANKGQAIIRETVTTMEHIRTLVDQTAGTVAALEDNTKEISQITRMITELAAQTNLLALNAAIEAARAGDAGRGFAVVAEEVRRLAEQSTQATKSIASIIAKVQADTQAAAGIMQQTLQHVEEGADIVEHSGAAFSTIVAAVQQVQHKVNHVKQEAEQQAELCGKAREFVTNIHRMVERNSGQTQAIAAVSEEQAATAQEITNSAEAMKLMASDLKLMVEQFQV